MVTIEQLRYPIGKFQPPQSLDDVNIPSHITVICTLPANLRSATINLNDAQLDTPYREGGWTIRQVVHHVADSHINSYCRFKLAMTEDNPAIRPYFEDRWAELQEAKTAPIDFSLNIIDAIHARWVLFLGTFKPSDFRKTFFHPEHQRTMSLFEALAMYSWHCEHHLSHIRNLKIKMDW